jgi:glycosyltransferase involved in cell wall biosynthesis
LRVLLSTATASQTAAHGGPVIASRQAAALRRAGIEVCVAAPDTGDTQAQDDPHTHVYRALRPKPFHFPGHRPNQLGCDSLTGLMERADPDVLYDVHGPAWAIDAAVGRRIPVVSMIGDYAWYCRRNFLVDSRLHRCSGPESIAKCFACVNEQYSPQRRMAHIAVRQASRVGIPVNRGLSGRLASLRLWDAVDESEAYLTRLRAKVDCFVIGDAQAQAFFLRQGVPRERLARIAQCLPEDVLRSKRSHLKAPAAPARALRIAFVGRPSEEKGIQVIARAIEGLSPEHAVELWVVHKDHARREALARFFKEARRLDAMLESGRVKLFRPESHDQVLDLMAAADVGVVPSIAYESPSLALLEFVAQGTPVIRSESRGMDHVIQDGINGRTFPYGDWRALRDIVAQTCARPDIINAWRMALPRIGADDDYAHALIAIFARVTGHSTSMRESALA